MGMAVYYGSEALLDLSPGQTVTNDVRFRDPSRIRDDDITTFTSKGIFLLVYPEGEETYGLGTAASPRWWPARAGQALRERISELFQGDTAAFLTAILTGDRSGLSAEASSDLTEAGLSHVLAVSGMHCGFLLAFVMLLTGRHRRRLKAGAAIPILLFYALLTGASPSVVRACVMLSFLLAAPLFQRDSDPPTAMCTALAMILAADPFAAASVSLQLSFGAVAGLLWLTPRLYLLLGGRRHGKLFRILASSFSATMGALVCTVPLCAYYFGTLVLVSPLSNLLCLWAASGAFLSGLAAVVVGFLWMPLGALLGLVPRVLTAYLLEMAHLLASLPYHALSFTAPCLGIWLAFVYLLFAVAWLGREKGGRRYVLAAVLAAASLACTIRLGQLRLTGGDLDVLMLDVGQGESILLSSHGSFALVDCGSSNSWYDAGSVAASWLSSMGCRALDHLILTHYDADHVDGVEMLLARIPVKELVVPDVWDDAGLRESILASAKEQGVPVTFLQEETVRPLGESEITLYPPVGDGGDNEAGLTVLCTQEDYDLLITGDMDAATERRLLETYALPDIEALAVGHHGSRYSTSWDLLRDLTPETALISVGSNAYGHPSEETLWRIALAGADICRTDLQGTIHLCVKQGDA